MANFVLVRGIRTSDYCIINWKRKFLNR